MKLLVVHNPGSFSRKVMSSLGRVSAVIPFEVDCKDNDFLSKLGERLKDIKKLSFDGIMYISGETRNVQTMYLMNFLLPSMFLEYAQEKKCKFFYLSSLAVFAGVLEDHITLQTKKQPLDTYGYTKWAFDYLVENTRKANPTAIICGLYPASFYSGNGRSSIETYQKILAGPLSFLRYIRFMGSLSYIPVETIIEKLTSVLFVEESQDFILAEQAPVADIWPAGKKRPCCRLPFIRPPLWLFRCAGFLLPKKLLFKIRLVLRGVTYAQG